MTHLTGEAAAGQCPGIPPDVAHRAAQLVMRRLAGLKRLPPKESIQGLYHSAWSALQQQPNGLTVANLVWARAITALQGGEPEPNEGQLRDWAIEITGLSCQRSPAGGKKELAA